MSDNPLKILLSRLHCWIYRFWSEQPTRPLRCVREFGRQWDHHFPSCKRLVAFHVSDLGAVCFRVGSNCWTLLQVGPFSILVLKRQYGSFCLPVLLRPGRTGETWNWERRATNECTVEILEHSSSTIRWERHSAEGYWIQRYHRNL